MVGSPVPVVFTFVIQFLVPIDHGVLKETMCLQGSTRYIITVALVIITTARCEGK